MNKWFDGELLSGYEDSSKHWQLMEKDNQIAILEKALELAVLDICVGRECNVCPYDNICDSWQGLHKEKAKDYFINKAKEELENGEFKS